MEVLKLPTKRIFLLCLVGILCLTWALPCYSQTGSKSAGKEEELPLNITADRLEVEQNQQVISFINNVVARYKDMILYADILKIFYQAKTELAGGKEKTGAKNCPPGQVKPSGTDSASVKENSKAKDSQKGPEPSPLGAVGIEKILRIEAQGKVRMVQGDRVATGDKAIYYTQEEKIVLLGNPQLWRGDNSLKGQEIVLYLKDNRAVVEGDPNKRVEAIIYPSSKVQLPGKPAANSPQKKLSSGSE